MSERTSVAKQGCTHTPKRTERSEVGLASYIKTNERSDVGLHSYDRTNVAQRSRSSLDDIFNRQCPQIHHFLLDLTHFLARLHELTLHAQHHAQAREVTDRDANRERCQQRDRKRAAP